MLGKVLMLIFILSILGQTNGLPKADAAQQILDILNNPKIYNKDIRAQQKEGPLTVLVNMVVHNVDVIPEKMEMKLELTFRMQWKDPRLIYSISGVDPMRFHDASKFWIPAVSFKDATANQYLTRETEEYIQVGRNGEILYSTRLLLNVRCQMNFKEYPFDKQHCKLTIKSYGHTTEDVVIFYVEDDPVKISKNVSPVGYSLIKYRSDYCNIETFTGEYSCLSLDFDFHGEPGHYVVGWYIPCILCVIIAFLSGLIEPSALLPRLILTISSQLFVTFMGLAYFHNSPAPVSYITSIEVFAGISWIAIFATLLHVLISYRWFKNGSSDEIASEGNSKLNKFYSRAKQYGNGGFYLIVVGIYTLFVIIYFLM